MLLLLVENDEPQILTGGEDRGAGAHGHLGIALIQPLPLIRPFPCAQ